MVTTSDHVRRRASSRPPRFPLSIGHVQNTYTFTNMRVSGCRANKAEGEASGRTQVSLPNIPWFTPHIIPSRPPSRADYLLSTQCLPMIRQKLSARKARKCMLVGQRLSRLSLLKPELSRILLLRRSNHPVGAAQIFSARANISSLGLPSRVTMSLFLEDGEGTCLRVLEASSAASNVTRV